jgi:hypothetical protein
MGILADMESPEISAATQFCVEFFVISQKTVAVFNNDLDKYLVWPYAN